LAAPTLTHEHPLMSCRILAAFIATLLGSVWSAAAEAPGQDAVERSAQLIVVTATAGPITAARWRYTNAPPIARGVVSSPMCR
jgi:hypothetical protein